jgi:hypothetical protein
VPGPLPLLGVGAAFGYSRRLNKLIKADKATEAASASDFAGNRFCLQKTVADLNEDPFHFKPMTLLQSHRLRMLGGCTAVLLSLLIGPVVAAESQLLLRPSQERFPSGDRIWWLEWRQGKRLLQRWAAASGAGQSQGLDRRWNPGNGAPLPAGSYLLGRPEPWGRDLWIGLEPRFSTRRSGLGIHNCFPGVGCICLPQRRELDQLASLIRKHDIRRLVVLQ